MAPTRKSKSVNKQYSSIYEVSLDKDAGNSRKSKPKKKLVDKLGSQWSKAEIERFYKAYREYGKDWKKVAVAVRNRSTEMVKALYSMNQAYLSLPDGTASVIGLIAMMIDHYSVLDGSGGEREISEPSEIPQKAQKCKRAKVHLGSSKEDLVQPQLFASSRGCLSLLKRAGLNGIHPHAVQKRTPQVPVSYPCSRDDTESYIPPNKRVKKSEVDDNDDEHVAALTLTGALQRGDSPHVSQTPYKRAECRRSSPVQSYDRMLTQSDTTKAKLHDSSYECWMEGRPGGTEPVSRTYARDTGPLMDMEGVGTVEVHQKGKKFYRKKIKVEEIKNNLSDDGREACSSTEEGIIGNALKGKVDMEISSAKNELSPWSQRKRSKKLVFGDESSSLDALLTLATLSTSMLPTSIMESESSVRLKEDRITFETDDKSSAPEAAFISHHRVGEQTEAPPVTRQRTDSGGTAAMVLVSDRKITGEKLVVHSHPLFGEKVPFKKDALFPSRGTASLLNNPLYALRLARSVLPVPDRQYVMRRNMATVFSDIIDLSMKMTVSLVGAADLHRYTQIEWDKANSASKAEVEKAQMEKEKAGKEKEVLESRCVILESEKASLVKAVEEAKAAKDEAVATAASLRSEQERLNRVVEEAEEKIRMANSKRDDAVKTLDEERAVAAMRETAVREEAGLQIITFGMSFRRSAIFMIKEKYPDLDFSDINFSDMKGHEENPLMPVNAAPVQPIEEVPQAAEIVEVVGAEGIFQGRVTMLCPSRVKK